MSSSSNPSTSSFTSIALSDLLESTHGSQGFPGSSDGGSRGSHIWDGSSPRVNGGGVQGSIDTSQPACNIGSAWRNVCSATDLLIRGDAGFAQCDTGSNSPFPYADVRPLCISQQAAPGSFDLISGSSTAIASTPSGPGVPGNGGYSESRNGVVGYVTRIGTQYEPRAVGSSAAPDVHDPASPTMNRSQGPESAIRLKSPEELMRHDSASPAQPVSSGCSETICPGFSRMPRSSKPATSAPTNSEPYCREKVWSATEVLHTAFPGSCAGLIDRCIVTAY